MHYSVGRWPPEGSLQRAISETPDHTRGSALNTAAHWSPQGSSSVQAALSYREVPQEGLNQNKMEDTGKSLSLSIAWEDTVPRTALMMFNSYVRSGIAL